VDNKDQALLFVGQYLRRAGYRFITPTPLTVQRVGGRAPREEGTFRDIFGWNRQFSPESLPVQLLDYLQAADAVLFEEGKYRTKIRFATIGAQIFVHSGFPTAAADAVFFGPDTYRFARSIDAAVLALQGYAPAVIVDIGSGTGAGGIHAASRFPNAKVLLTDVNAQALRYAAINAKLNEVVAEVRRSDVLSEVSERPDLIVCNPPYLVDAARRVYRHGGGAWGCDLSVRVLRQSLNRLTPQGVFLLYTGTPIVDGTDIFLREILSTLKDLTIEYEYEELDPDIFGEELERFPYTAVERISAVRLIVKGRNLRSNAHAS
jgi:methylase of polypeptide subunit release factors